MTSGVRAHYSRTLDSLCSEAIRRAALCESSTKARVLSVELSTTISSQVRSRGTDGCPTPSGVLLRLDAPL
jgi:hypothetical protein